MHKNKRKITSESGRWRSRAYKSGLIETFRGHNARICNRMDPLSRLSAAQQRNEACVPTAAMLSQAAVTSSATSQTHRYCVGRRDEKPADKNWKYKIIPHKRKKAKKLSAITVGIEVSVLVVLSAEISGGLEGEFERTSRKRVYLVIAK